MTARLPGQPPLALRSLPNLRDVGGWPTRNGGRISRGLLYRSEQLGHITDADMPAFVALGLKMDYDLRTAAERAELADRLPAGAGYVVVDVLADAPGAGPAQLLHLLGDTQQANAQLGGGKIAALFRQTYAGFVTLPSARAGFGALFKGLADPANLPAIFHCTTGKDRTGWVAAALLTLCGVCAEDVMRDYLLSNDYILPEYEPMIARYKAAGVEEEILLSILGVRRDYLDAAFAAMRAEFGDVEQYFAAGLGIDQGEQAALRALFVAHL